MSQEELTPEEQEAMNQTANAVANALLGGQTIQQVVRTLVDQGWSEEDAAGFVNQVQSHITKGQQSSRASAGSDSAARGSGNALTGWLGFIGVLILINFLSYVFDWPFWIY